MLGSLSEADDAVQDAWLRVSRSDPDRIDNLGARLTTVVVRVCLDMLRSRTSRREESLDARVSQPIARGTDTTDPEQQLSWLIRLVSPCSWLDRLLRRSGSHSCCTTCSACPSTKSQQSWSALQKRPVSLPVAHAVECRKQTIGCI